MSSILYTPFTCLMLQDKRHVNVSNIVDFMTNKPDFQERKYFLFFIKMYIFFLPRNHCVVDTFI